MKRPTPDFRWWWWVVTLTISFLCGLAVTAAAEKSLRSDSLTPVAFILAISAGLMSGIGLQRSFRWLTDLYRRKLAPERSRGVLVSAGRPTPDFRSWWWVVTLTISFLCGLAVTVAVEESLKPDRPTPVTVILAIFAGLMSGIGLQRSFRWLTDLYRRELAPEQSRGVLVSAGGVACLILGGVVFVVGVGMLFSFQESHSSFWWDLASGEIGSALIVFSSLGLIAVGIRLFKGKWPGKGYWS